MNVTNNHPTADERLLFAYGELPAPRGPDVEAHLAGCASCQAQFAGLERGRVLAEWTLVPRRRRAVRWTVVALAAAAVLAAILLIGPRSTDESPVGWPRQREWSANAGYIAGGQPLIAIDAQLTRLEQERSYVLP